MSFHTECPSLPRIIPTALVASNQLTLHDLLMRSPDTPPRIQLCRTRSSPPKPNLVPAPIQDENVKIRFSFTGKLRLGGSKADPGSNTTHSTSNTAPSSGLSVNEGSKRISREKSTERRRNLSQVKVMNLTSMMDLYKDLRVAQNSKSTATLDATGQASSCTQLQSSDLANSVTQATAPLSFTKAAGKTILRIQRHADVAGARSRCEFPLKLSKNCAQRKKSRLFRVLM